MQLSQPHLQLLTIHSSPRNPCIDSKLPTPIVSARDEIRKRHASHGLGHASLSSMCGQDANGLWCRVTFLRHFWFFATVCNELFRLYEVRAMDTKFRAT
jgi:hypothetical protein